MIIDKETNFREVKTGTIAAGILCRSSNPLKGGELTKEKLAIKAGINCILNLDDETCDLNSLSMRVPWYHKLVQENKVIALKMNFFIPSLTFNRKLKEGLKFMINCNGPYLVHCYAGVDRAGFVIAILEALMGASIKEICDDYLLSFDSEYTSSFTTYFDRREKQIFDQFEKISGEETINDENIQIIAQNFLLKDVGLSADELNKLTKALKTERVL